MSVDPPTYEGLADLVLLLHAAIACFVIFGLVVIVGGNLRGWRWVNDLWLRLVHLIAIGIVVGESWLGFVCPLTTLEMWLRERAGRARYAGGFIEHWLQTLLFYSAPPWVFILGYSLFGALVLMTWWLFPPRGTHAGMAGGCHAR